MVDIHSHILWGMDDGSPTEEVSLEMLRMAAASGTTDIVATPHSNCSYPFQPELVARRVAELTEKSGGIPCIHRGCDLHISFENITSALQNPSRYSINGRKYLLVECSDFGIAGSMERILDQLRSVDLIPILTHPERNSILQNDLKRVGNWVDRGCLVQITALSILGRFGARARSSAARLLSKGLVHAVASDAHNPEQRHPRLDRAFAAVERDYGRDLAQLLFVTNPGCVIRGEPVATAREKRKWWKCGPDA